VAEQLLIYAVGDDAVAKLVPQELDGHSVQTVQCKPGKGLLKQLAKEVPDVMLMDARHAADKTQSLDHVRGQYHDLPVILVGKGPATATVVECMRKGAEDFVDLSEDAGELAARLLEAARKHDLAVQVKQLSEVYERGGRLGELVGISPAMHDIYATIKSICGTDATVLVWGESGTGKELVAHAVHALSPRNDGAFVPVNCAAIPKDLLESELFGHEKGAFTSAERQHIGSCERAHKGTLFLDEISEMDMGLQSKVLRFLQNQTFTRVGGTESIEVDSRVIAATNKDPHGEVESGNLRDDLYYRLNVVPIYIPPLRERPEDIPVLAEHFLAMMGEKYSKYFWDFSPEAVRLLLCYPWPGNVRELRNTIERIVVLANTDRVTPELFPERVRTAAAKGKVPKLDVERARECIQNALQAPPLELEDSDEVLPFVEVERRAILGAIRKCDGDISKASRKLGLSRATLYRKLDKYGVKR
jgi:DNA-binding NtrC family response regulator